jgi:hypothetical protein
LAQAFIRVKPVNGVQPATLTVNTSASREGTRLKAIQLCLQLVIQNAKPHHHRLNVNMLCNRPQIARGTLHQCAVHGKRQPRLAASTT